MARAITSLLILLALSGCGGMAGDRAPDPRRQISDSMKTVEAGDGINRSEAAIIAWAYFATKISACGVTGKPERQEKHWVNPVYFGVAGVPIEPIFIDIQTGEVIWRDTTITLAKLKKDVAHW